MEILASLKNLYKILNTFGLIVINILSIARTQVVQQIPQTIVYHFRTVKQQMVNRLYDPAFTIR